MFDAIANTVKEEIIFAELTKRTLVICDKDGFERMQELFFSFETTNQGTEGYTYYSDKEEIEEVYIEKYSEKYFTVYVGKDEEQLIHIFHVENEKDFENIYILPSFENKDIWLCAEKSVTAITEFRNVENWGYDKILLQIMNGRFLNFKLEDL
jgi:hypothetical protein